MAGRSSTTFAKLQKERSRREKQLEKEQQRRQRSLEKKSGTSGADSQIEHDTSEPRILPDTEGNL
jgi:hypothetical protein